jgi:hypothetical protein
MPLKLRYEQSYCFHVNADSTRGVHVRQFPKQTNINLLGKVIYKQ